MPDNPSWMVHTQFPVVLVLEIFVFPFGLIHGNGVLVGDRMRMLLPYLNRLVRWGRGLWGRRRVVRFGVLGVVVVMLGILGLELAARFLPFDDRAFDERFESTVVLDRQGQMLRAYLAPDDRWRIPADLDSIAPVMVQATLAAEDWRFYEHSGIDWVSVCRAAVQNFRSGKIISGASTISMQVAGFAIPSRERTLARKLRQAFLAMQIERHWSKRKILETYLTRASYGGNICGVEAAALHYFGKPARNLTAGEAALLAGLPQSPERHRPDRHAKSALERREYVLRRLAATGSIPQAKLAQVRRLPLRLEMKPLPVYAPHFCDELRQQQPDRRRFLSTVDLGLQKIAEEVVSKAVAARMAEGVTNGAAVILQNDTGEVLALVGSADYWNRRHNGQVNAATAFRSPGSALKPLIFARALDIGALTPDETLFDVPASFAGYIPGNFDGQFRGPVDAPKALAWSLNMPALDVLSRIGAGDFAGFMAGHGVPLKINKLGDPGLSLAIGTCSVRLIDLACAYASLAEGGVLRSARWTVDAPGRPPEKWISPGAASVVAAALSNEQLRAPENVSPGLVGTHNIAWKTGTSNGLRDAWTIAVTEEYTVAVWLGNMDGRPSRGLVGVKAAAPVALELARSMQAREPARGVQDWTMAGGEVRTLPGCAISGLPAGPGCTEIADVRLLKEHLRDRVCHLHQGVQVDAESGFCLCEHCAGGRATQVVTRMNVPQNVASWLRENAHPWAASLMPPHDPACALNGQAERPTIVLPSPGTQILQLSEIPLEQQKIALQARTADPEEQLFWFVDGSLAGVAAASEIVSIAAGPGRHRVTCSDKHGRSAETWFSVESEGATEVDEPGRVLAVVE